MNDNRLQIARSLGDLRHTVAAWRAAHEPVALVPTMGALHAGHLALVRAARSPRARIVVSVFVNPKQFGPTEDFAAYPRNEAADLAALREVGVDLAYMPPVETIYPPGFATTVSVARLTKGLCGAHRPGHFDGVATVVAKLLLQALPDRAYFGEKDYQQLMIIKRLARDLDISVEITGVPIVRESDGLALSSRNVYLSTEERRVAPLLYRTLSEVAGAGASDAAIARGRAALDAAGLAVEYLELRDAATLAPVAGLPERPARLLAAVHLGRTRLIDNTAVAGSTGRP
ncbi:MAG: pantoate--beta-alanine ligase [Stellaceae bacterium]